MAHGEIQDWESFPALSAARKWSLRRIGELTQHLSGLANAAPALRCIVLTGSLARLDACPQSDFDAIVVLHDDVALDGSEADATMSMMWERLAPLGLRPPKSSGVFVSPTSRQQLCDGPRGVVDEDVNIFGKRIQLLLEARAVLGHDSCIQLQRDILQRYASHPFADREGERWSYLVDDLIRYWRSYRVWRHWDISSDNGGWYLRNLKLRHSRLLSYAALLISCLTTKHSEHEREELLSVLSLTPLERIRKTDLQLNTNAIDLICQRYDKFLHAINDETRRHALEKAATLNPQHALSDAPVEFTELIENADGLVAALSQLVQQDSSDENLQLFASTIF